MSTLYEDLKTLLIFYFYYSMLFAFICIALWGCKPRRQGFRRHIRGKEMVRDEFFVEDSSSSFAYHDDGGGGCAHRSGRVMELRLECGDGIRVDAGFRKRIPLRYCSDKKRMFILSSMWLNMFELETAFCLAIAMRLLISLVQSPSADLYEIN